MDGNCNIITEILLEISYCHTQEGEAQGEFWQ